LQTIINVDPNAPPPVLQGEVPFPA
jgi:hypothetical protein